MKPQRSDDQAGPIGVRVIHWEPLLGTNGLLGLVSAAVQFGESTVTLRGLRVFHGPGGFHVTSPKYRARDGELMPVIAMGKEVWRAISAEVDAMAADYAA